MSIFDALMTTHIQGGGSLKCIIARNVGVKIGTGCVKILVDKMKFRAQERKENTQNENVINVLFEADINWSILHTYYSPRFYHHFLKPSISRLSLWFSVINKKPSTRLANTLGSSTFINIVFWSLTMLIHCSSFPLPTLIFRMDSMGMECRMSGTKAALRELLLVRKWYIQTRY